MTWRSSPPLGSGPDFYSWVKFEDRWEIYERGSLDPTGNTCPDPADEGFIRGAEDRGWGHFAKNKFIGWGPGGFWTGKFVDGDGNPARFLPPEGEFNTRFVGPFWLFGELDDD